MLTYDDPARRSRKTIKDAPPSSDQSSQNQVYIRSYINELNMLLFVSVYAFAGVTLSPSDSPTQYPIFLLESTFVFLLRRPRDTLVTRTAPQCLAVPACPHAYPVPLCHVCNLLDAKICPASCCSFISVITTYLGPV